MSLGLCVARGLLWAALCLYLSGCSTVSLDDEVNSDLLEADRAAVLQIHRNILQAILTEDIALLYQDVAVQGFSVMDGEVRWENKQEQEAVFKDFFAKVDFTVYRDAEAPYIKFSADQSMAVVLVSVDAVGTELDEKGVKKPITDTLSAWIEVYEKINGRWVFIGSAGS